MTALRRSMAQEPASEEHLRSMQAAAWHKRGYVCVRLDEISDPAVRAAFERWAEREFGRRSGGGSDGQAQG
jgi:hypothetical protein